MVLESDIAEWVKMDNEQHECLRQLKRIREAKTNLQVDIERGIQMRGLENPVVKISDGRLAFVERKVTQGLTLTLVEDALTRCITDEATVKHLMECIKNHRRTTHQVEMKRYYNKRDLNQ
jgi:hypothetical protein